MSTPSPASLARRDELATRLGALYNQFDDADAVRDPIQIVRRFSRPDDQEIVAFMAAGLAFGRVQSVLNSVEGVLRVMAPSPADFVRRFAPARDRRSLDHLVHRWTRGVDLAALVWLLRQMIDSHGSIEGFFAAGLAPGAATVEEALDRFSQRACALDQTAVYGRTRRRPGVSYFFARPSSGGACKRLNLFLRWMVRKDRVDLGLWTRVSPAQLIVPLDTHVIRVGRCLRLTRYASPGWRMAADITRSLRALDPRDPVRFDFSLCHLGMMDACGRGTDHLDRRCPLRGLCHPGPQARSHPSRRPQRC